MRASVSAPRLRFRPLVWRKAEFKPSVAAAPLCGRREGQPSEERPGNGAQSVDEGIGRRKAEFRPSVAAQGVEEAVEGRRPALRAA
jgi:hypothetical protein